MSGSYHQGRTVEYAVAAQLRADGYDVVRAAHSAGPAGDLIAFKPGQVLIVNVKRTKPPGPAEREALLKVAAYLPGVVLPLVALGPASRLTFRRLTGPAADQWVPWSADELADVTP